MEVNSTIHIFLMAGEIFYDRNLLSLCSHGVFAIFLQVVCVHMHSFIKGLYIHLDAACRPERAETTSDWPRRQSAAAKTPSILVDNRSYFALKFDVLHSSKASCPQSTTRLCWLNITFTMKKWYHEKVDLMGGPYHFPMVHDRSYGNPLGMFKIFIIHLVQLQSKVLCAPLMHLNPFFANR